MTTSSNSAAAPSPQAATAAQTGFYKNYTFDKTGQVFADGKALSGIQIDTGSLFPPQPPSLLTGNTSNENPYAMNGGVISKLSADSKGNLYAELGTPTQVLKSVTGAIVNGDIGSLGTVGPSSAGGNAAGPTSPGTIAPPKVKLSGVTLDPAHTSSNSGGALGENTVDLRQEQDGLYFAQIKQGEDIVAYAYSAYQGSKAPTGGPAQASSARRQGGNAGGGAGPSATTGVSLLGS